jgi:hypothetical protein
MGLEKATRNAHEVARNTLNFTQKKMKRDYDVKIKLQRVIFTAIHDRLKARRDRKIHVWLQKCEAQLNRERVWFNQRTKKKGRNIVLVDVLIQERQ